MSLIGKEIKDFTVKAYRDGEIETVTKQDVLGKWSLFFFYPADFTFVCPTELEDLADNYEEFKKAGAEVYSVSCDTEFVHKEWHETSERIAKVKYPMLADPAHKLAKMFKVLIKDAGQAERGAFIVDPEGRDSGLPGQRRRHRPQRLRAAASAQGRPVRRRARRPGLPRQVAAGRRHARTEPRPRRPALDLNAAVTSCPQHA